MPSLDLEKLINSPYFKFLGTVIAAAFAIGVMYNGMQNKLDEMPKLIAIAIVNEMNAVNKKLDEHIITASYENKMRDLKFEQLSKDVAYNTNKIEIIFEAVKPDRIEIKEEKRR